ncbi:hypothetical protein JCM16814_03530 [Desulfobaculum senezii]
MKYILFEDFSGQPSPVLFSHKIRHEEMREQLPYSTVLSAGYVEMTGETIICHGASKALGAQAEEGDAAIIQQNLNPAEG